MSTRTNNILRNAAITFAALTFATPALSSQELEASVTIDTSTSLATYDFAFDGPAKGYAVLFASVTTTPAPFAIPGIGVWELEIPALRAATVALDSTGKKSLKLSVPLGVAPQLAFQPLFIDTSLNLRLAPAWGFFTLRDTGPMAGGGDSCAMSWSSKSKVCKFTVGQCALSDLIVVKVNGRVVCQFAARRAGKRSNWFKHPNLLAPGTKIEITKNGKTWFTNPPVRKR